MAGQKRGESGGVKPRAEDSAAAVDDAGYRERVFEIVRRIPAGRVMTYGQLAGILGEGYTARTVGYVMHAAGGSVPWQRVVNAQGACSTGRVVLPPDLQQRMLESEGVAFDARGRCDLARLRWTPEEFAASDDGEDDAQPSLFAG
ncbi:MAG TPA: MGMT family protein [Pyrinomonadaceae bacterium]|jgi:methylated-DNA-protein-cysteine methyltransferase-like protein